MVQRIGELLVTCFILAIIWLICRPILNQVRWEFHYGNEIERLKDAYRTNVIYAGTNDDRFPSSMSDYDRYLMSVGRAPTEPLAAHYWGLPGTCATLKEFMMKDVCKSPVDDLPDSAQPSGQRLLTWHSMTGASFDTSSRFGIFHIPFTTNFGCDVVPMFWTHPYRGEGDDPMRMVSWEGKTSYVQPSEFETMMNCLKGVKLGQE